ncbi:MAG: DUF309 domain-containing protein [Nitriliruptoraceae bacterium]
MSPDDGSADVDDTASSPPPSRDRRDDGRPEQARPRDRTGRPLPYEATGVALIEDHEPASVEAALELGIRLWEEERFFESHECLEHVWHASPADDADLWQGVIQMAVAGVHLQRDNPSGATALLRRACERLSSYPDEHRGVAVTTAVARCSVLSAALERGEDPASVVIGRFPAAAGGAWFARDPSLLGPGDEPTPIPDEPTWVTAGRPRSARRRD